MVIPSFVLLAHCQRQLDDGRETAQAFLNAYVQQDFSEAIPLVVDTFRTGLRMLEKDLTKLPMPWPDSARVLRVLPHAPDTVQYAAYTDSLIDTMYLAMAKTEAGWRIRFERNDPIHVARSFLRAFHRGQFRKAAQWVSPNSMRDLEMAALYYRAWQGPEVTIKSVELGPKGRRALVSYREKGNTLVKKISLIKVKGYWKVSFGKEAQW